MIASLKNLRIVPIAVALFATLFGLVQTPLMASAMHASMVEDFEVEMFMEEAPMTMAFMSTERHVDQSCDGDDCSRQTACMRHCLEQATSRDTTATLTTQGVVEVPAILTPRLTYPEEDPEPLHFDQLFSHVDARAILLSIHKRE